MAPQTEASIRTDYSKETALSVFLTTGITIGTLISPAIGTAIEDRDQAFKAQS